MDDKRNANLATVWFAEELLTEMGEQGGLLLLEQVKSGQISLDEISGGIADTRRKEPGEFGMELAGSMLVALLTSALKPFFDKYVEKLTGKLADKAADKTIDLIKRTFLSDLRSSKESLTYAEIRDHLELKRKGLGLSKNDVDRVLKALDAKRTSREPGS